MQPTLTRARAAGNTVAAAVARYLAKCDRDLRATTARGYRQLFEHDVLPKWGDWPLAKIDHVSVQQWATENPSTTLNRYVHAPRDYDDRVRGLLDNAVLAGANLAGADFRGAQCRGVDWTGANLDGTLGAP